MAVLALSDGYETIVDDEDVPALAPYKWRAKITPQGKVYASRGGSFTMHRQILKAPKGFDTDHVNGHTLDNRRQNLRVATRSQNAANSVHRRPGQYRGVYQRGVKWRAGIQGDRGLLWLGTFADAESAARAYDAAALERYGNFARLNFPQESVS